MQKKTIQESTRVADSLDLNVYAREPAKHIYTELLIVEDIGKLSITRNPIDYARPMYRMSIGRTPHRLK